MPLESQSDGGTNGKNNRRQGGSDGALLAGLKGEVQDLDTLTDDLVLILDALVHRVRMMDEAIAALAVNQMYLSANTSVDEDVMFQNVKKPLERAGLNIDFDDQGGAQYSVAPVADVERLGSIEALHRSDPTMGEESPSTVMEWLGLDHLDPLSDANSGAVEGADESPSP